MSRQTEEINYVAALNDNLELRFEYQTSEDGQNFRTRCRCTTTAQEVSGSGTSKRASKHNAARKMYLLVQATAGARSSAVASEPRDLQPGGASFSECVVQRINDDSVKLELLEGGRVTVSGPLFRRLRSLFEERQATGGKLMLQLAWNQR